MLRFSRKVEYCLQALLHMQGQGPERASAREIAECHRIPVELTAKLLQQMTRAGLCESRQGSRGGYLLARPASEISLSAIVAAADGPDEPDPQAASDNPCDPRRPLAGVLARIASELSGITLASLALPGSRPEARPEPRGIYLDHQATTPVDPRVLSAMLPYLGERFGNAASAQHAFGWEADEAVKIARERVANLIAARAREIVWTSGATESNNLAIKGVGELYAEKGRHLISCVTEHPAVLDPLKHLKARGWEVTLLPVDSRGRVSLSELRSVIRRDTTLVSLMAANNETGIIHPIAEIGEIARSAGALLHVDAAQAYGKIPIDVDAMRIDLLSISGHKIYGPKGVGALFVRGREPRVRLAEQIHGGGHEQGRRSGTLNVAGIVGLGAAAALCADEMRDEARRLAELRDRLARWILSALPGAIRNGDEENSLPGTASFSFPGIDGDALLMGLRGIALSSGSACTSATLAPSHVLQAMGHSRDLAHSSLRVGLGRFTTAEEIETAAARIVEAVTRLRAADRVPGP